MMNTNLNFTGKMYYHGVPQGNTDYNKDAKLISEISNDLNNRKIEKLDNDVFIITNENGNITRCYGDDSINVGFGSGSLLSIDAGESTDTKLLIQNFFNSVKEAFNKSK